LLLLRAFEMSSLSQGKGSNQPGSPSGASDDFNTLQVDSEGETTMDLTRAEGQPRGTPPSHNGGGQKRKHDDHEGQEGRNVRQRVAPPGGPPADTAPLSNEAVVIAQAKEIERLKLVMLAHEKKMMAREQELKAAKAERDGKDEKFGTTCPLCDKMVESHHQIIPCTQLELPEDKRPAEHTVMDHAVHKTCGFIWNKSVIELGKKDYTCPVCAVPKVGGGFLQIDRKTDAAASEVSLDIFEALERDGISGAWNEHNIHIMEPVEVDQARYEKALLVGDYNFQRRTIFEAANKKVESARKAHASALIAVQAATDELGHLNYAQRLKADELAFRAANPPAAPVGRGAPRAGRA